MVWCYVVIAYFISLLIYVFIVIFPFCLVFSLPSSSSFFSPSLILHSSHTLIYPSFSPSRLSLPCTSSLFHFPSLSSLSSSYAISLLPSLPLTLFLFPLLLSHFLTRPLLSFSSSLLLSISLCSFVFLLSLSSLHPSPFFTSLPSFIVSFIPLFSPPFSSFLLSPYSLSSTSLSSIFSLSSHSLHFLSLSSFSLFFSFFILPFIILSSPHFLSPLFPSFSLSSLPPLFSLFPFRFHLFCHLTVHAILFLSFPFSSIFLSLLILPPLPAFFLSTLFPSLPFSSFFPFPLHTPLLFLSLAFALSPLSLPAFFLSPHLYLFLTFPVLSIPPLSLSPLLTAFTS